MELIPRKDYLRRLRTFRDARLIKVITGVRGCGKTALMTLFIHELKAGGVEDDQIVRINFEDYDAVELTDPKALHAWLTSKLRPERTVHFFLDEIQNVSDFRRVIDSLCVRDNVDIYLTGSSNTMPASDLAAPQGGRHVEIRMLPMSFGEFVEGTRAQGSLSESFCRYLEVGAFPYALSLPDAEAVSIYEEGLFSTILLKDLAMRTKLSDASLLFGICRFLFENVGSLVAPKRIADHLSAQGRKCDVKTVGKYLNALRDCFVFHEARRFDIHAKAELARFAKYYPVDLGLRRAVLGSKPMDVGDALENVVYLELVRRGFEVYVGRVDHSEVDFVAKSAEGYQYIQVSATVRDPDTQARELRPLQSIKDHYPKLLLTLDDDPDMDHEGIRQCNALEWLLTRKP